MLLRFDVSAKTGEGIEDAMRFLVDRVLGYEDIFVQRRKKEATFKPGDPSGKHGMFSTALTAPKLSGTWTTSCY